jgi:hypothetical protein
MVYVPAVSVLAKIEALSGIGQNDQVLAFAADSMQKVAALHLAGHLYELYQTRARVSEVDSRTLDRARFD